MHPFKVHFGDDLSDTRLYNDRFIESRVAQGNLSSALYVIGLMHNIVLLGCLVGFISDPHGPLWILLLLYVPFGVGFCLNAIRLAVKYAGHDFVRFNRRMQLVHFWGGTGKQPRMMHMPWREAVPFTEFVGMSMAGGNHLKFLFPTPKGTDDDGRPIEVKGDLTFGDGSLVFNLNRLEFWRRYMAEGLKAVQPDPEMIEAELVKAPSGYTPGPAKYDGLIERFFHYLLDRGLFYYLAGGPLIDRWIKRAAENYRWPEEVECLCAEDADLTGFDTAPIPARTDVFYQFGGPLEPIIYVDAQGQRLG